MRPRQNTQKKDRPECVLKRSNIKSIDGGTLLVFVLRRKFQATAVPRLIGFGDGDYDSHRTS